jgi:hypothetical protein
MRIAFFHRVSPVKRRHAELWQWSGRTSPIAV